MNIRKYLKKNGYPTGRQLAGKKHQEFVQELFKQTSFLDNHFGGNIRIGLRLTCAVEGINKVPKCYCGKHVKPQNTANSNEYYSAGFSKFCSLKCSNNDPSVKAAKTLSPEKIKKRKKKTQKTLMDRYGVDHSSKIPTTIQKRKDTCIERFGATSNLSTENHRQLTKEKLIERYGVENPMQSEEIRERSRETVQAR